MLPLRSVVCAVDFSEPSREALRWAGALARRHKARLTVVSAPDLLLAEAARMRFGRDLVHDTELELRGFAGATWSEDPAQTIDAGYRVQVGPAAEVILDIAANESADLLVLGTHGLGGVRKWLLGSTTERVLRRTRTPLLAVPPSMTERGSSSAKTAPLEAGPVLAATDFSDAATRAAAWAADLAKDFAKPLCLVHVVEPIAVPPHWQAYLADTEHARIADAGVQLQTLATRFAGAVGVDPLVERGHPAETIAAVAEQRRASLIVMGLASSRVGVGSRPGSIAYRVLCLAKVPVVVVPPQPDASAPPTRE